MPALHIENAIIAITPQKLAAQVERLVRLDKLRYIDALVHISTELDIDPADMGKLVKGALKDKLENEAKQYNFLPKDSSGSLFT